MGTQESSSNTSSTVTRVRRTTREQLRLVDKSLKSRFTRVRNRLVFMLQSTLGAGLAFYVAHDFFGHEQPFFAPMAVIIILGLSGSDRINRAVDMAIGGVIGVLVGTLLVDALGTGPIHMTIIIGLALIIGSFVTGSQLVSNQIVIAAILIATILPPEEMGGVSRAIDAIIGAVIGLTMIMLIPTSPLRAGRSEVSKVLGITSSVLNDVSKGLEDDDPHRILEARDAVRGTQGDINNMLSATKGGAETARLSPFLWGSQRNVRSLERVLTPVDNVVRGTRVLSRRALVLSEDGDKATTEQIELIDALSDIMMELSGLYSHQSARERRVDEAHAIPDIVHRLRQLAARSSMDIAGENPVLSAYSVLAQTRSIIVDLLMICGMSRESAVAQLAPTSNHPAYPPEVLEDED
ncbi:FUSC family protein [Corynebacterium singulare]|uniref:Putative membrane protein n=1 Tax=Corynebacterium singulare TaxID=161899 RepID=A0A0B6F615_9CORY|nr:FUSC family protein [Corynebacterium singulare]AJI79880.1 putative membrane protein [Corynebacterium singulare]